MTVGLPVIFVSDTTNGLVSSNFKSRRMVVPSSGGTYVYFAEPEQVEGACWLR